MSTEVFKMAEDDVGEAHDNGDDQDHESEHRGGGP